MNTSEVFVLFVVVALDFPRHLTHVLLRPLLVSCYSHSTLFVLLDHVD